jgi:hypothetical protein
MDDDTKRLMKETVPTWGDDTALHRLDEVFSRDMLGSVFVGTTAGKMVEQVVKAYTTAGTLGALATWTATFVVALVLFIYWESAEHAVNQAAEKGKEVVTEGDGQQ